jgi:seryl-tRNA synthetase
VEGDGVVLRTFGTDPSVRLRARDHVELLEAADALDLARGARTSGARFAYLKGEGALLELALVRYAIDVAMAHGHTPVIPPVLVREEAMYGTGFLPTDEQQLFVTRDDDLYLVGTSEVPLAALHMDEVLEPDHLPLRYVGYSPCFRREAGAHGKDTRGILRVHQFEKVELFSFVAPTAPTTSTSGSSASRRRSSPGSRSTPRSSTSRSATSARPRRASSTSRRGCRARRPTARSPRAPTPPTTRPAGCEGADPRGRR